MVGIDRRTGARLSDLDSAFQSVEFILSTRLGSVVLLREFGGGVAELLGRAMSASLFAAWRQLIASAIDLWEPRFRVRRVTFSGSVEQIRLGRAGLVLEVDYRPGALTGDFTVAKVMTFGLNFSEGVRVAR